MKPYMLPRLRDVLFMAVFFAALLLGPRMLNMDGDLPRHMAIGRYVLQGNLPPVNDIFSHTVPGAPFAPHKWLSGVLFYLAYLVFEERGMVLLSATALAATFTIIYVRGGGPGWCQAALLPPGGIWRGIDFPALDCAPAHFHDVVVCAVAGFDR